MASEISSFLIGGPSSSAQGGGALSGMECMIL
jgi:hypothetical protein